MPAPPAPVSVPPVAPPAPESPVPPLAPESTPPPPLSVPVFAPESGVAPPDVSVAVVDDVEVVTLEVFVDPGLIADPVSPPGTVNEGTLVESAAGSLPPHEATPRASATPPVAEAAMIAARWRSGAALLISRLGPVDARKWGIG